MDDGEVANAGGEDFVVPENSWITISRWLSWQLTKGLPGPRL
jgi:hypothetical protein